MKLSFNQIKEITMGAVLVKEDDGMISLKRWIDVNKVDRKKRKNYTLINIASFSLGVRPLLW